MKKGGSTDDDHHRTKDTGFQKMVESIKVKLGGLEGTKPPKKTIYKVPADRKASTRNPFSPRFISIGPIHGRRPDLLAMEEMKLRYTSFFLFRSKDPVTTLALCSSAIMKLEVDARKCYARHIEEKEWDKYQLAEVLLVDGCFILELFLRRSGQLIYPFLHNHEDHQQIIDISRDPLLNNNWIMHAVCQDLALIENQIPFMVLKSLCDQIKTTGTCGDFSLTKEFVLDFFSSADSSSDVVVIDVAAAKVIPNLGDKHFLEILHDALLPSRKLVNGKNWCGLKYGATKLLEDGVDIKKADDQQRADNFQSGSLEIVFDVAEGVLRIPQFWIGGLTSSITRNLVAMEQCSFQTSHHVTAYVMFMKSLICTPEDVQLLKRKGVIKQTPESSDQNVMEFFGACCKDVALKDFYFSWVCEEIETYVNSWGHIHRYRTWARNRRRRNVAYLKREYCPNACRTVAFFGGIIVVGSTVLQTVYAVYSYYHPPQ